MMTPFEDTLLHNPPGLHALTVAKYLRPGSKTLLHVKSIELEDIKMRDDKSMHFIKF